MNFFDADANADSSERQEEPFQLTAMVDVVFILLSFFVMATQLRMPELDLPMSHQELPLSDGAALEDFPTRVILTLRRTSSEQVAIQLGQAPLPDNDFDGIRARLAEINLPKIPVLIQTDAAVSVEEWAQALDAVLSSPMNKISIGLAAEAGADGRPGR